MQANFLCDPTGVLILEDDSYFYGKMLPNSFYAFGEICFNTAMVGYQEVISYPSYAGQIVVFSFPHIGNVGTNQEDEESAQADLKGVILGEQPTNPSNFRATATFLKLFESKKHSWNLWN